MKNRPTTKKYTLAKKTRAESTPAAVAFAADPTSHATTNEDALVEEVVRLSGLKRELAIEDILEAIPALGVDPVLLTSVTDRCRRLGIEITDDSTETEGGSVVDISSSAGGKDEEATADSLTLYLRQIGRVPLLGKEGEQSKAKELEEAENKARACLEACGGTAQQYLGLARKVDAGSERIDQVCEGAPEVRMKIKTSLPGKIAEMERMVDAISKTAQSLADLKGARAKQECLQSLQKQRAKLQRTFRKLGFHVGIVLGWAPAVASTVEQAESVLQDTHLRRKGVGERRRFFFAQHWLSPEDYIVSAQLTTSPE